MTQEEKAKAYDEKLDVARHIYADPSVKEEDKYYIEVIFPELAESEDEKIRKELIRVFSNREKYVVNQSFGDINVSDILAWLEKQGGKESVTCPICGWELKNKGEQKPLGFNIGDEITVNGQICKVVAVEQKPTDKVELSAFRDKLIELFQRFRWYCKDETPTNGDIIEYVDAHIQELIDTMQKPVENKGMNLVEEEMTPFQKKVFCIIDTTIEEEQGLKQICDELLALASNEIKQESSWSEDDEKFVHGLIRGLAAKRDIHGHTTFSSDCINITETINWLNFLKDRYTWKPSDEYIGMQNEIARLRAKLRDYGCEL